MGWLDAYVATDDAKLVRLLRIRGIPFILPALLIHRLWKRGKIRRRTATDALEKLRAFISEVRGWKLTIRSEH